MIIVEGRRNMVADNLGCAICIVGGNPKLQTLYWTCKTLHCCVNWNVLATQAFRNVRNVNFTLVDDLNNELEVITSVNTKKTYTSPHTHICMCIISIKKHFVSFTYILSN